MANHTFAKCFNPDLGPYKPLPLYNMALLPEVYRNIASQPQYFLGIEHGTYTRDIRLKESIKLNAPSEPDPATTWHNICGYLLYEVDGFGTKTFSGYNLVWQYQCDNVQTDWIRYVLRLIKISATQPLDVTVLATEIVSLGGAGGIYTVEPYLIAFPAVHEGRIYKAIGVGAVYNKNTTLAHYVTYGTLAVSDKWFTDNGYDDTIVEIDDPNEIDDPPYGPGAGGEGGGTGRHELPDEDIPVPTLPTIGAASVSWLHLFKMSESDISAFGNDLVQATNWQAIQAFFSDPLDAIIGINLVPVDMPTSGQRTPVIGSFSWSRAFDVVSEEFYELDCGYVNIDPYWDSAFDMNPFTKIFIFLPFIGVREINADEVMGAAVGVVYHVDVCTGDCTAFVTKKAQTDPVYGAIKDQVIAQFNGNCAVRVPTGRVSQDAAIGAAMSILGQAAHVGGAIAGAAFGAPETIAAAQVATQVSTATMHAVEGGKTKVERSGSLAAAAGYMGILKPYIIRAIPQQVLPTNYKMLEGYPANKAGSLSQFRGTGLNTVEAIQLEGFTGYDSEQDELISILQGGVEV